MADLTKPGQDLILPHLEEAQKEIGHLRSLYNTHLAEGDRSEGNFYVLASGTLAHMSVVTY